METWPKEISQFLDERFHSFIGWECEGDYLSSPPEYDKLVSEFGKILKQYSLRGFHCTRLTEEEIFFIRKHGLTLQNLNTLCKRIDKLVVSNQMSKQIADCLMDNNQSGAINRANKLWFCFFPPHVAGQHGIERFFRHWGGEALYNSHENNPVTGEWLQKIGTPCVIEALVPLKSMPDIRLPYGQFIRSYLKDKGYFIEKGIEFEGYIIEPLNPINIIDIHQFPCNSFIDLTGCAHWDL